MSQLQVKNCPKCGNPTTDLVDIDARVSVILKEHVNLSNLPPKICLNCFNSLTQNVSHGVKLRLEQQAREKNRHLVWKSRVNLIKHARHLMAQKNYSEAAVSYEKYIRVLEISYDLKPGALTPDVFGKSARSKELTVITTTYWDLLRIYDTHPKYRPRMLVAAQKLALFIPYSPLFAGIVKNAQIFTDHSKNPDIMKEFLKMCKASTRRCFIASSTYQDNYHPDVITLRLLRDTVLLHTAWGRALNSLYNRHSPALSVAIDKRPWLRKMLLPLFKLSVALLRLSLKKNS